MSLVTAMHGFGNTYQNPYIENYKDKLQAKFNNGHEQLHLNPADIQKVQGTESLRAAMEARAVDSIERPTFSEMIERGVDHVDAKQKFAGNQVRMLMTGESDNLHEAMVAMEESGVAFNLMLETRNKLMSAYQELMRMNV